MKNIEHRQQVPTQETTDWELYMVVRWLGGEALSTDEQARIRQDSGSQHSGITDFKLESDEDIPFAYLSCAVATTKEDIGAFMNDWDDDMEDLDPGRRNILAMEAAFTKGIVAVIGAFTTAGIPASTLELQAAHAVTLDTLAEHRASNPLVFVDDERYRTDEAAHSIFRDTSERFQELASFD